MNTDEMSVIFYAVGLAEGLGHSTDEGVVMAIRGTSFAPLLAEGFTAMDVADVLFDGVTTVEGARLVLAGGTPAEWVRSFEGGVAR